MMRWDGSSVVLLYVGSLLWCSPALSQPLSEQTVAAIDGAMTDAISTGWVAGGVVEVSRGHRVVFSRAYGLSDLEGGVRASTSDVFRIGSLTKQFTATAILLLVEDGKLSLDQPLRELIPSFPREDQTTIRQLLNHTSGIVDYVGGPEYEARAQWLPLPQTALLDLIYSAKPLHKFPPGTDWDYSNSNYVLLGAVVERVSHKPYAQFLRERIFDPLGMVDTALDDGRDVISHRARGYDRGAVEKPGYLTARPISMSVPFSAGGLRSTASDLLRWSQSLAHGRLLREKSYKQMTMPARLNDGSLPIKTRPDGVKATIRYGFGVWSSDDTDHPNTTHDGGLDGFTSRLSYYPAGDLSVVMLVNTSPSDHLPFGSISRAVEAELKR